MKFDPGETVRLKGSDTVMCVLGEEYTDSRGTKLTASPGQTLTAWMRPDGMLVQSFPEAVLERTSERLPQ